MSVNIQIDAEFKALIPPLQAEEFKQLEENILAEGCRDPLVVWNGTLIDGHNRYQICTSHRLGFKTIEMTFADREAVKGWIDANQIGRRNLHPDDFKIVSGRIYNRRKKTKAEAGSLGGSSNDQVDLCFRKTTSEVVASELGISAPTVRRNGQRAEVYDMLSAIDTEAATAVKVVPQDVIALALKQSPDAAAETVKNAARPHVSFNSGEQHWYTPQVYLEAAREVMGPLDLDPASSDAAQKFVKAKRYYTIDDDGINQDWKGVVWLNPPYGSGIVDRFAEKLVGSLEGISHCIALVNNATETKWFQLLANHSSAICFPATRIRFLDSTGEPKGSPLQGQVFFYFGPSAESFLKVFNRFGFVVEVWQ